MRTPLSPRHASSLQLTVALHLGPVIALCFLSRTFRKWFIIKSQRKVFSVPPCSPFRPLKEYFFKIRSVLRGVHSHVERLQERRANPPIIELGFWCVFLRFLPHPRSPLRMAGVSLQSCRGDHRHHFQPCHRVNDKGHPSPRDSPNTYCTQAVRM